MEIKVRKLVPEAKLPIRATVGSLCFDVSSTKRALLSPMERVVLPTGLAFELPRGIGMDIRPRSGLASKGLAILNSPGTLDSDYRGELKIICMNLSSGNILISGGDRIAQIRLIQDLQLFYLEEISWKEVNKLSETERGESGFGSTGE